MKLFLITCGTTKGDVQVEVPSATDDMSAAARRAQWTLISQRTYGDVPDVTIISAEIMICRWYATCDNDATRYVNGGPVGEVPTCDRCAALAEKASNRNG